MDALGNLVYCYYQTREYGKAWDMLQRGMKMKPKDFRLMKEAFDVALQLQKREEARAVAAEFVTLFPLTEETRKMREVFPDLP